MKTISTESIGALIAFFECDEFKSVRILMALRPYIEF